jgi:hypothetical protein
LIQHCHHFELLLQTEFTCVCFLCRCHLFLVLGLLGIFLSADQLSMALQQ